MDEEIHEILVPYGGGVCIVQIKESELFGCPVPQEQEEFENEDDNE